MGKALLQEAKNLEHYLLDVFYQIHRNPELSSREYQTQALILAELEQLGIEAKPIADTGVLGIIRGGKPGKTAVLKASVQFYTRSQILTSVGSS